MTQPIMSPMWQKGKKMNKYTYYRTLKLLWPEVSWLIGGCAGQILGRTVDGTANFEDDHYWGFQATQIPFTVSEINYLLDAVNGDNQMRREAIPIDSEGSCSIGEGLSRALLRKALQVSWVHDSTSDGALWLIGVREVRPMAYQRTIEIGAHSIRLDQLKGKEKLLTYLNENGSTHSALMDFCEEYRKQYHNELCWNYPISDGLHLGTFFLLVKEGVIALPYDEANKEDYELLCMEDIKLCDLESMESLMEDWEHFDNDLWAAMKSMQAFYKREEEHHEAKN